VVREGSLSSLLDHNVGKSPCLGILGKKKETGRVRPCCTKLRGKKEKRTRISAKKDKRICPSEKKLKLTHAGRRFTEGGGAQKTVKGMVVETYTTKKEKSKQWGGGEIQRVSA